eukprot:37912-Amphidinium_carterae.1
MRTESSPLEVFDYVSPFHPPADAPPLSEPVLQALEVPCAELVRSCDASCLSMTTIRMDTLPIVAQVFPTAADYLQKCFGLGAFSSFFLSFRSADSKRR